MKISNLFDIFLLLCLLCVLTEGKGKPKNKYKDKDKPNNGNGYAIGHWKQYFVDYGYIQSRSDSPTPHEIRLAVTKLKILLRFNNSATDDDIIQFLQLPRCGNRDLEKNSKRQRRYELYPAWRTKSFKYTFEKYSSDLTEHLQDSIADQAFQLWKDAVPELNFIYTQNVAQADIKFSFEISSHGCAQTFDGPGPIIAHAYLPEDGRVHLDDDEHFTDQSSAGTNLFYVLVHEIGHALGLGHSFVTGAVMNPVYQGYTGSLSLHEDDINGMRQLYAPNTASDPMCVDQDPSTCALYNAEGYCTPDYADVMVQTCPQTCNLCP